MASTSSSGVTGAKTRLKDATEKRRVEHELKEKKEIKRHKKMFAPRKLIGPRDVLVNSYLPKIKLEEDVESISTVKQDPLDAESTSSLELQNGLKNSSLFEIIPEVDDNFVVNVEETLDLESTFTGQLSEVDEPIEQHENLANEVDVEHKVFSSVAEQNDYLPKVAPESKENKVLKNHVEVVREKEQGISIIMELIQRLQIRLKQINSDGSSPNLVDTSPRFDNVQVLAQLTKDLQGKDEKTNVLCCKMLKLQSKIFAKLLGRSFKNILPIMYPELQLSNSLDCRSESIGWQTAVSTFAVEMGNLPTWNEPPLHKLPKVYIFTQTHQLGTFTVSKKGKVATSKLFFDNISIESIAELKIIKPFLTTFADHIKYLKIRQCVSYADTYLSQIKVEKLMDFVKFCLEKLPNLIGFTLIICKGEIDDKTNKPNCWRNYLKHKTYDISERHTYAKLEKLESLVIDFSDFAYDFNLNLFASSLIDSYSKQLKQFSILVPNLRRIERFGRVNDLKINLVAPNLSQLIVYQSFLSREVVKCKNVEKCTIINHENELKHYDMILIQAVFPKLTCLRLKFLDFLWKSKFHDSLWTTSTPKLSTVLTLELEMCHNVTFSVLEGFPNLRYLKLIHDPPRLVLDNQNYDTCLHILELFQGKSLYELKQFWEKFPNILLVTLELCKVEGKGTLSPKLYTYTRDGYVKYCNNISK